MKQRRLAISGDLWLELLRNPGPQQFKVAKNRLPEDVKCVRVDASCGPNAEALTLYLVLESSVFQDSDPDELPSPILEMIPKGE